MLVWAGQEEWNSKIDSSSFVNIVELRNEARRPACIQSVWILRFFAFEFFWSSLTRFGCFSFGPEHIQSPDIWSPSIGPQEQTVPAHLVPETIGPPGQLVPKHLVPMDKWSPGQLVPLDKWSPNIWSPWTNGPPKNWSPWTIGPQNFLTLGGQLWI